MLFSKNKPRSDNRNTYSYLKSVKRIESLTATNYQIISIAIFWGRGPVSKVSLSPSSPYEEQHCRIVSRVAPPHELEGRIEMWTFAFVLRHHEASQHTNIVASRLCAGLVTECGFGKFSKVEASRHEVQEEAGQDRTEAERGHYHQDAQERQSQK